VEQKHTLYAVVGPDPQDNAKRRVVSVCTDEEEAESLLASGVLSLATEHAKRLKAGGSVSIMLRRGAEGEHRTYGYGSIVMTNPNDKHAEHRSISWDFAVLATTITERGPSSA
jgi:hypothetical protein